MPACDSSGSPSSPANAGTLRGRSHDGQLPAHIVLGCPRHFRREHFQQTVLQLLRATVSPNDAFTAMSIGKSASRVGPQSIAAQHREGGLTGLADHRLGTERAATRPPPIRAASVPYKARSFNDQLMLHSPQHSPAFLADPSGYDNSISCFSHCLPNSLRLSSSTVLASPDRASGWPLRRPRSLPALDPSEWAVQPIGDVSQVTNGHRATPDLDVRVRSLADFTHDKKLSL